jgi:hypothetical protein
MKSNELEQVLNDFGIEVCWIKSNGKRSAELNTYTEGGVNMIVYLDPFTIESFCEWVDDFDIDYQIDLHRQDKKYREAFSITDSIVDFADYLNRMKEIRKYLEDCRNKKKTFTIKTKFVFEGEFYVKAESKVQAREFVGKHCGFVIGGDIHSSLPDEDVHWKFNIHPKKIIT